MENQTIEQRLERMEKTMHNIEKHMLSLTQYLQQLVESEMRTTQAMLDAMRK